MCTETFLRLPEEKRTRILDAAWEEFTTVPFAGTSINQIVRRAGIPRGSFYQYFGDKSDLFSCLMESVRAELLEIFHRYLKTAGGDLFRTALLAYDGCMARKRSGDSLPWERCVSLLQINPGIDLEAMLTGRPEDYMTEAFWEEMDLTVLRRRDRGFVRRVCCLTGMALGGTLMDSLVHPDRAGENREELIETLDIIGRGSLTEAALREGGLAS